MRAFPCCAAAEVAERRCHPPKPAREHVPAQLADQAARTVRRALDCTNLYTGFEKPCLEVDPEKKPRPGGGGSPARVPTNAALLDAEGQKGRARTALFLPRYMYLRDRV